MHLVWRMAYLLGNIFIIKKKIRIKHYYCIFYFKYITTTYYYVMLLLLTYIYDILFIFLAVFIFYENL